MVSQMIAWEGGDVDEGVVVEGQVARIYTKSCFVFQLKRDEKSETDSSQTRFHNENDRGGHQPASRSNLMIAYSSFFGE